MNDKSNVLAAVTAAVAAYLEEEQGRPIAVPQPRPPTPTSMWRVFGRWEAMRKG